MPATGLREAWESKKRRGRRRPEKEGAVGAYQMGSKGDEVRKIQERLKSGGFYKGPVDGDFGGGTEAAVKAFQQSQGMDADGVLGPLTWKALFKAAVVEPAIHSKPLDYKCLSLTASFETGQGVPDCFAGLSGDFDGQGMSFGVLQWNFGQGSLQPLLREMTKGHPDVVRGIFQAHYDILVAALSADQQDLLAFVRSIQHPVKHFFFEPWRGMFKSLGRTEEFQEIQLKSARRTFAAAGRGCAEYGLWSERAVALMFDIRVQNGSIKAPVKTNILRDVADLPTDLPDSEREVRILRIVANRRAEAANPVWVEDVRARKLCIANGGGVVHGIPYDLAGQFGIGLKRSGIAAEA